MFDMSTDAALRAAPGPVLVTALAGLEVDRLEPQEQVVVLQAWERVLSWATAKQQRVMTAIAGVPDGQDGGDDWGREEVAAALHISGRTAAGRLAVARILEDLPLTSEALATGRIGYWHAVAITDELSAVESDAAAAVELSVLADSYAQTPGALRRSLRRAVATLDPVSRELAHARAVVERRVRTWPEPDGMATLAATLPAADVAICMTALSSLARRSSLDGAATDAPGVDARRADALVALCSQALADPALPRDHRHRPAVGVLIDLPTLLGLADHAGELAGYGPIPAAAARVLAAEGLWHRLVTDPVTGALLDRGQRSYKPSQSLVDYVLARDATCRFPTCAQPASRCDIDHAVPHRTGGATSASNLGLLCRRHHRLKHEGRWRLDRHKDASCTWTSPAGARYRVPAPRWLPQGPEP
ncbi:MAG: HNH endonuclease [Actinomycetota bacterium]|nr:HNH endonuclease [Actinomycetota bacterium]